MRRITIEEQRNILKVFANERFVADMMKFDCIYYGGPAKDYGEAEKYIRRVIDAFPKDILKEYDQELKKAEADKLRAQADKLENS